nr:sulfatase-like hydrolase/transferase [Actinomadura rudentiformis]
MSEDNNPFIGAYGDRLARTPAIDRLAQEGVRYENSFSTAPVCAPSRFAIITGMSPESCGPAEDMRASGRIPAFLRGFPEYLREGGYYCTNNARPTTTRLSIRGRPGTTLVSSRTGVTGLRARLSSQSSTLTSRTSSSCPWQVPERLGQRTYGCRPTCPTPRGSARIELGITT